MKEYETETIVHEDAKLFASSLALHLGQALQTRISWDIKFHDVSATISLRSKRHLLEFSFDQKHTEIAFIVDVAGYFNARLNNLKRLIAAQRPDLAEYLISMQN